MDDGLPASLQIRLYGPADLAAAARLWRDSWVSTGLAAPDDARLDGYQARLATHGIEDWRIHLACEGDAIVGFLACQPGDGWLRQLFVEPARQARGVGKHLLAVARREMPTGFWLRTDAGNARARLFYERRGLRPGGEAPHPSTGQPTVTYFWFPAMPDASARDCALPGRDGH